MNKVPAVVVHMTSGTILEAAFSHVQMRVVPVDDGTDDAKTGEQPVTAPDGNPATIRAHRLRPDRASTAGYVRADSLPEPALPTSISIQRQL